MIPWLTAIPADPEDPQGGALSDEFEDASPSNQYLTIKDAKRIGLGLVVLVIICIPLYKKMHDDHNRYLCGQNFLAISHAMTTYLTDNDEQFPPTYVPQVNSLYPRVDDKGRPYTWASTLVGLSGFDSKKHSFNCPSALDAETMNAEGLTGADLPMSYGMYGAYNTADKSKVANAGRAVLVTETANDGATNTFDPMPMPPTGGSVHDGFLIGLSTGDFVLPAAGAAPPPSVTRIAVPNSKGGITGALYGDGRIPSSRHDDELFVLFVDGHYRLMKVNYLLNKDVWEIPTR